MNAAGLDISLGLKGQLRDLIVDALRKRYISTSSHMNYTTGNAYQSVDLGEAAVEGYRQDRSELFKMLNLQGRRILDCGCNIGELSRLARKCGASLVDGIEYDAYFVQIAQLINAYQATTRVSFVQGDLTKPGTIKGQYDVSMAFSVFPYILPVLPELAAATKEALILETHNVVSDLPRMYVDPVGRFFPFHTFVDYTDFGHGEGKRAVFVFAKDIRTLTKSGIVATYIDLENSSLPFLKPMRSMTDAILLKERRSIEDIEAVVQSTAELANDIGQLTAGRSYWLAMMRGYLEFKRDGMVSPENIYVITLRSALFEQNFDPVLAERLASQEALIDRVANRFEDIDRISAAAGGIADISPVSIINFNDAQGRFRVRHSGSGKDLFADLMDGYHRMFWADFFGIKAVPALFRMQ